MSERMRLLGHYFRNDRMKEYEDILSLAIKHEYQLISLSKYVEKEYDSSRKLMIIRHDVDNISPGTLAMFLVEKKYEAYASYYFRWDTAEYELIQNIVRYGSEASLHFETIANFMKRQNIDNRKALEETDYKNTCIDILKSELQLFRLYYNVPCITIASHGAAENGVVMISNNALTEDTGVYNELGIRLEAYCKNFIDEMEIYISDTVMEINGGYRYGKTPQEAIQEEMSPILFLSHPNHWLYTLKNQLRKIGKMILKRPAHIEQKFKRISI